MSSNKAVAFERRKLKTSQTSDVAPVTIGIVREHNGSYIIL
jgi:hypothetical protein